MGLFFISLASYIFYVLCFSSFFQSPTRFTILNRTLSSLSFPTSSSISHVFTSLMLFLILLNFTGNIPFSSTPSLYYVFTATGSISGWAGVIICVFMVDFKSFISHMLPYGSPLALSLLLPLIEVFSHLIRPFTLMIRLSTNLSSGHIMLYMFSFFSLSSFPMAMSVGIFMSILLTLELFISLLQAYIFTSLSWMYLSETL